MSLAFEAEVLRSGVMREVFDNTLRRPYRQLAGKAR